MNLFENLCIVRSLKMNRNVYSTVRVRSRSCSVFRGPCPVRKRAHNARDWSPVLWASLGLEKHGGRCDLLDQRFNHVLLLFQTSVRR